jgi:hypothetical protein
MSNNAPRYTPLQRQRLDTPDPRTVGDEEIRAKIEEFRKRRDEARVAHQDAVEQEREVERCEQADRRAEADHVRKGGKKPTSTAPKAKAKLEELRRKAEVLAIVDDDTEAELRELLLARGPKLAEELREQAKAEVAAAHQAALVVGKRLGAREQKITLALWLEEPGRGLRPARSLRPSNTIRKLNGDVLQVDEVLNELVAVTDPDPPPEITRDQRTWAGHKREPTPLRPVTR